MTAVGRQEQYMLAKLEFHYLSIVLSKFGSSITTTNYPALCLSVCMSAYDCIEFV